MKGTNPFWDYSLRLYAEPGVEETCLKLQQGFGVNVNMLLFCCWLDAQQVPFSKSLLQRAERGIGAWEQQVAKPLRSIRQWVKFEQGERQTAFYRQLKNMELDAERIEQDTLLTFCPDISGSRAKAGAGNLDGYLRGFQGLNRDRLKPILLASAKIQ